MADREFKGVGGFVQFDVDEREVNNQTVRDVTIRALGAEGPLIRVTVWEEHSGTPIERGDLVFIDGPYEERYVDGKDKPYLNMSATNLVVISPNAKAEPTVANKKAKSKSKSF